MATRFTETATKSLDMSETRIRIPTRVRQAPRFLGQMVRRTSILYNTPSRRPLFRLCYFSCHSYFAYLYCALHSLTLALRDTRYEVLVFSDTDQPLSGPQIEQLQALVPSVRVIPWPKSMGWGAEQIGWIWKAYAMAADGLADDDIVARVDSDVFFFNDRIFHVVERTAADVVGDGHFVNFKYCQGGNYFLKAGAVRRVVGYLRNQELAPLLDKADVVVEDVALSFFARQIELKQLLTWFMMFPDELRLAGGLSSWARWKFSCLHFVHKNKAGMVKAYLDQVLPPAQHAQFLAHAATV